MKRIFVSLILLLFASLLPYQTIGAFSGSAEKPNIILIITDDLDARSIALLPQLQEQLVKQGTSFANFFVTTSLCCPSRVSILRGQYAHNHQVLTNEPPNGGFQRFYDLGLEQSTVATWLQAAGYRTVHIGKYLTEYPGNLPPEYVPPGWDEWYGYLKSPIYYRFKLNENGKVVVYGNTSEDYLTDVEARIALDFIGRSASTGMPFFMQLGFIAPHNDVDDRGAPIPPPPAPRHVNEFANVTAPRPPSFDEEEVSDKPQWIRNRPRLGPEALAEIEAYYRQRLQSMLAVDEFLENLIAALEEIGALSNTYIFFISDNGFHMGEHRLRPFKCTPYEEDIRVPLIVRGPGVTAGRVMEHFALNIDLAPTIAELAGVPAPDFVDGRSLVPLLHEDPAGVKAWRQEFLVEFWQPSAFFPPSHKALHQRDHMYIEWSTGELELYDLNADPYELQSLHATADTTWLAQLSSKLNQLYRCSGEDCFSQTTAVNERSSDRFLPQTVALYQNFPNPFDRSTSVTYYLPHDTRVEATLYNTLGQRLQFLLHESQSAGWHNLKISSQGLMPGVYFIRLEAAGEMVTRKLVVTK